MLFANGLTLFLQLICSTGNENILGNILSETTMSITVPEKLPGITNHVIVCDFFKAWFYI